MKESTWVNSVEASQLFGVSEKTLNYWREAGYLPNGTYWRKSLKENIYSSEYMYRIKWCKEKMDYWKSHNANIKDIAA